MGVVEKERDGDGGGKGESATETNMPRDVSFHEKLVIFEV